ncbi:MAG: energy transducer TonB [Polaromonas sp.]|jgi:protein TonB
MNATPLLPARRLPVSRNTAIALAVVALHVGFIGAMQSGLLMRAVEVVVPVELLSQIIEPPAPKVAPRPPAPPAPTEQPKKASAKAPTPEAPLPVAIKDAAPAPNAPVGTTAPQTAPAPIAAPVAAAPAAPPPVQLPSSDADYLQNPRPPYPPISRRMNEQGKTTVRVLIGADGQPQRAEIAKSSGFSRLDDAALATVMRWRFVPGKRGGVAEAMWFNVPINWVLE